MPEVEFCVGCKKPIDQANQQYGKTNAASAKAQWQLAYAHAECMADLGTDCGPGPSPDEAARLLVEMLLSSTPTTRRAILTALAVCDRCDIVVEPGTAVIFSDSGRLRHVACSDTTAAG